MAVSEPQVNVISMTPGWACRAPRATDEHRSAPVVLILSPGRPDRPMALPVAGLNFAAIDDISPAMIAQIAPDLVLSPLFGGRTDACDIAGQLQDAGFRGQYRIVTDPLPYPGLVLGELRAAAPDVDVDFLDPHD